MKKQLFTLALLAIVAVGSISAQNVIIPEPQSVVLSWGEITIQDKATFSGTVSKTLESYLVQELKEQFDVTLSKGKRDATINFDIKGTKADATDESYTLKITPTQIRIVAKSERGAFYALRSLIQLMRDGDKGPQVVIAAQSIEDAPRFAWRAYMLDEGRYFQGEKTVLKLLDAMAELKLNVFHWHLTDDQGWRIESKKYPLLTQVGSKRKDSQVGGFNSTKYSGEAHGGFYTQDEIKRIVKYAAARQIKVVPEIEMPGHASAAIAAYPWLGSMDEKIEVATYFGKHYPTFDVTNPKVVAFLKELLDEFIPLFNSDIIHIGGDEVKFEHWKTNPRIVQYTKDKGYASPMDLQIAFSNEMSQYIASKGMRMMGWNEILGKNLHGGEITFNDPSQKVASNVIVQFWKGDPKDMAAAAKDGYQIVNSYHAATYLDYGFSLKDAYSFDPMPKGIPSEFQKNIIGSGCQMWGEWTPNATRVFKQSFPRIAAYAEVGWSAADKKNYDSFVKRLRPLAKIWRAHGIEFNEIEELKNL